MDFPKIKRALVSVYNKSGLVDFVKQLVNDFGIEILSTGGTARILQEAGIPITFVSDYTQSPEMFDGRVKTLHPRIHGGLLMRRDNQNDVEDAKKNNILPIDMVICNLYPFKDAITKEGTTLEEAIEMIDIGGPTQIRAAAKSFPYVTVIPTPKSYKSVIKEMYENEGKISLKTRMNLAQHVFSIMSLYDATIANYLSVIYKEKYGTNENISKELPDIIHKTYEKVQTCRYGENWEQKAAYYKDPNSNAGLQNLEQLHGKAISFNNWLDIDSCIQVLLDFHIDHEKHHICAIFKHTTPNGIAVDYNSQLEACKRAFSTDPLSAFGGIWGFNQVISKEVADYLVNEKNVFIEVLLAPDFEDEALKILETKKNMRIVRFGDLLKKRAICYEQPEIRGVLGGALVQDYDWGPLIKSWDLKTKRDITVREKEALIFAYRVSKWTKSNSAAFVKEYDTGIYTLGIGAGQQSRVHVVKLAAQKAKEFNHDLKDSVMGTDSFFPFPDGLVAAAEVGAKAIINPGGSIRDEKVISKADELGISLIFCGKRVFRH
ncbi:bifunctional phosphoribosylaminoimidazolecarboxamide formyltransferase/IMP cyclohydrolase [Promethearchaeum syntrophicum]|uniref:Bifunctional phosphoribosylaminoimidazolecarboxamide formyltransferase/IMP cyclohydrolase n=1 Tax=Promethearchaeum syntrophicum TaxID=2594042 RepID=A0A5B9DFL5_9ARCH|nr:bifunctional phosphoribosylaminoimidazolecarboxamide formyltransferase/IMP cyclohydrolase [Candidatus Prometheoarchaeum syntrophicum]QEE17821.1 bifunctional phosphoribosylaminoimidazolecarboxamide formyltransferase/IMP cyclohydrolase [Candidatus Prometheoarchaeum syntrophicum]